MVHGQAPPLPPGIAPPLTSPTALCSTQRLPCHAQRHPLLRPLPLILPMPLHLPLPLPEPLALPLPLPMAMPLPLLVPLPLLLPLSRNLTAQLDAMALCLPCSRCCLWPTATADAKAYRIAMSLNC